MSPPATIRQFSRLELQVDVQGVFDNPFDPQDASLDALITSPSGKRLTVPGFYFQNYKTSVGQVTRPIAIPTTQAVADGKASLTETVDNGEILTPSGNAEWRLRFAPSEIGLYKIDLSWKTKAGRATKRLAPLKVAKGTGGFVGVSKRDPRYFALDDGSSYWPIGANLGWASARGTKDFEDWIPDFAKNGANWGRVWLSPRWTTFAMESATAGKLDLANAWRLDHVLDLAERNHMRLSLCVESFNSLKDKTNWPEWERSPLNKANGGPLANPTDFWTDQTADRLLKNKLRYLIARYGSSTSVMAWELWNEVDGTSAYKPEPIRAWHDRTAKWLKATDPYRHLIASSFGGEGAGAGDLELFKMKSLDYSQTHSYEAPDIATAAFQAHDRFAPLNKPHFIGEVGADTTGPRAQDDPTGLQLTDPAWAALASGDAGSAMPWWWDSYIYPKHLSSLFLPLHRFTKDIAFDREHFRPASASFEFRDPAHHPVRRDIVLPVSTTGFSASVENKPRTIRVTKAGTDLASPLSPLQQGTGNHPELHNPVTFNIDLPWPIKAIADIGDVSGYGGAALSIKLDGKEVVRKDFPDPNGDRDTASLKEFAGKYSVDVPAGKHVVIVENPGQDWFTVNFRLVGALETNVPALLGRALVGDRTVIAWVRPSDRTWRSVAVDKQPTPMVEASWFVIPSLKGQWKAEVWDTRSGKVLSSQKISNSKIQLPATNTDLAIKVRKQ